MSSDATLAITSARDRRAAAVQAVGRRVRDIQRRPWESLAIFAVFTAAYVALGYWLVIDLHVVGFDSLDRLNRALMIWHNQPAKLSAVGFDIPPLATLLISPLAIFSGLASSLVAVPIASAVFAAWAMVALNTMMRRATIPGPLRYCLLLAFGANPLVVLYAADGARDFLGLALVVTAASALFAWYITADVRFVMLAALVFALAALADYGSLLWFGLSAIVVAALLGRLGARTEEIEGTTIGFVTPTVYVVALWIAFNLLLTHRPFSWIAHGLHSPLSAGDLVSDTGRLLLDGAPIAVPVLIGLVVTAARGRDLFSWCWALLLASAIVAPAVGTALGLSSTPMAMRGALPILVFSIGGAIWLARASGERAGLVAGLLIAGLVVSIPWTFQQMRTFPHQGLEAAFTRAVLHDASQDGTTTTGGAVVGIANEQAMADWIRDHVHRHDAILTDNAQTYAVMLLTGRPNLFVDRVDISDGPWERLAKKPAGHVSYLLLSRGNDADLLSRLYPAAAAGQDTALPVVAATTRYTLVRVPADFTPDTTGSTSSTGGSR